MDNQNQKQEENIRKPSTQEIQEAVIFKTQGNEYFKNGNYEQAINFYFLAIDKDPTNSIYYSNISRSFFNLQKYEQALKNAEQAIKLDQKNIKAHYLAAQSLVKISQGTKDRAKIQKAIQDLKRSLTLCPGQGKSQFERSFVDKIYRAKKKLWEITSEQQIQKRKALRKYLVHLNQTDDIVPEQKKDEINQKILQLMQSDPLKDFSKIQPALICPITKMLLKDPVCNQFGNSYSRDAYFDQINKNGGRDPITNNILVRKTLVYNNINLKKAIQSFLEENIWAYDEPILS